MCFSSNDFSFWNHFWIESINILRFLSGIQNHYDLPQACLKKYLDIYVSNSRNFGNFSCHNAGGKILSVNSSTKNVPRRCVWKKTHISKVSCKLKGCGWRFRGIQYFKVFFRIRWKNSRLHEITNRNWYSNKSFLGSHLMMLNVWTYVACNTSHINLIFVYHRTSEEIFMSMCVHIILEGKARRILWKYFSSSNQISWRQKGFSCWMFQERKEAIHLHWAVFPIYYW